MILKKTLTSLPENEKVYKLNKEDIENIFLARGKKQELDPGMGGIDPVSLDKLLETESKIVSLDFAITGGCNFKCSYCYRPCNEWGRSLYIKFDLLQKLIKEAAELGVKYFIITGGEPLLYKDNDKNYFDIINEIKKVYETKNMIPSLLTFSDVALITKKTAKQLSENKVSLCLKRDSLDHFIQNSILGVKNGSKKMEEGYSNLFEVGYGIDENLVASVNTVLCKNMPTKNGSVSTTDGLIDLHIWIKQHNLEHSIIPIHYCGEAVDSKQTDGINTLDIKVLYDIISCIDDIMFGQPWKTYSAFAKNKTCNRPGRGVHIRSTGDITACSESPLIDKYTFGNIYKSTLIDSILSTKFEDFKKGYTHREGKYICNSNVCDLYANKLCKGGCATRSANSKVNINTGLIEKNTNEESYSIGREDPFCPGWIVLAKKQNALKDNIYEEYTDLYLEKSSLSSDLKQQIRDRIVKDFYLL